jgi:hypothetical protein
MEGTHATPVQAGAHDTHSFPAMSRVMSQTASNPPHMGPF